MHHTQWTRLLSLPKWRYPILNWLSGVFFAANIKAYGHLVGSSHEQIMGFALHVGIMVLGAILYPFASERMLFRRLTVVANKIRQIIRPRMLFSDIKNIL